MPPREHAVLARDLADDKQVFVLTDHASKVLARRTLRAPFVAARRGDRVGTPGGEAGRIRRGDVDVRVDRAPVEGRRRTRDAGRDRTGVCDRCWWPAREAEDFTRDTSDAIVTAYCAPYCLSNLPIASSVA